MDTVIHGVNEDSRQARDEAYHMLVFMEAEAQVARRERRKAERSERMRAEFERVMAKMHARRFEKWTVDIAGRHFG